MFVTPFCRLGQMALVVIIVTHTVSTNSSAPTTKGENPGQVKSIVTLSSPECVAAVETRFTDVDYPALLCGSLDFFQVIYPSVGCLEADFNLLSVKFCKENNTDLQYEFRSNATLLVSTSGIIPRPTELHNSTVSGEDAPVMTSETPNTRTTQIPPTTPVTAQNTTNLLNTKDIETSATNSTGNTQSSTTNGHEITEPAITNGPEITEPVITNDSEITEPAITNDPEITEPAITNDSEITEPVITNDPEITEPAITNDSEITEPVITNDPEITEPVIKNNSEITEPATTNATDMKESTFKMSTKATAPNNNTTKTVISTKTTNITQILLDNINCVIENFLSPNNCRQFIKLNKRKFNNLTRGCEFIKKQDLQKVDCSKVDRELLNQILCDNVTVQCPNVEQVLSNITQMFTESCKTAVDSVTEDILKDRKTFCDDDIKNLVKLCTDEERLHIAATFCPSGDDNKVLADRKT